MDVLICRYLMAGLSIHPTGKNIDTKTRLIPIVLKQLMVRSFTVWSSFAASVPRQNLSSTDYRADF